MSGERQLIDQGFTGADLEFLQDILPRPETAYSTVVYDILWAAAEYRTYLALARTVAGRRSFTSKEIITTLVACLKMMQPSLPAFYGAI